MDPTNSRAAGTIDASGLYAIGYYNACYQYGIEDMHLTITDAGNGALQVGYWVKANGQEITDVIQIEKPDWYLFNSSTGNYYFYSDNITYELASTLPASRALAMTKTLSHTHVTKMSYYVSGIISNMRNIPEEIVKYTQARFDISDDGTKDNQFYCYNTKWLGNTDFTTGNEIALGDKVIIYGPVQNYNGNTPEIKGYVYQHSKSANYEITNLKVRTEGSTVYFSFESDAPYFHVKVIDANGETTAAGIIDFKSVSVDELADGTYTLWIRPVDEAQEYYIGNAVEEQFTIDASSAVDYAIYNLNVTTEGNVAHFSWDSEAPYFHIKITYQDGTNVVNTIIDFKNAKLSDLTDGTYTVWIRPVDEAQEYYVSDAVETQFVISTTGTDVEDMHIQQTTQLYDLMGRLVDTKLSSDSRPFNVPANGIYIQRQGDSTTKIYINKQ
jgi:predicted  nucleic acid-binding Zn-ribbon protein